MWMVLFRCVGLLWCLMVVMVMVLCLMVLMDWVCGCEGMCWFLRVCSVCRLVV